MDVLTSAVVQTAQHEAVREWGDRPRLYALVRREELDPFPSGVSEQVSAAPADALIPIEQDQLPEGEPVDVLAGIHWPAGVAGCVLVTEVLVVPSADGDKAPRSIAGTGQPGQSEAGQARLTVGVLREGEQARQMCCLQFPGNKDLLIGPGLADDLATALMGTL